MTPSREGGDNTRLDLLASHSLNDQDSIDPRSGQKPVRAKTAATISDKPPNIIGIGQKLPKNDAFQTAG